MPRRSGFTLFEVLAAVAVLGILYTVLATKTSQGVWNEANARSRLEASLRADEILAELETGLAQGGAPERELREYEDGAFRVVTEVTDFALPGAPLEAIGGLEQAPVFGDASRREPSVAVRISVRVSWEDAGRERHVERVTFGLDRGVAQALAGAALVAGAGS